MKLGTSHILFTVLSISYLKINTFFGDDSAWLLAYAEERIEKRVTEKLVKKFGDPTKGQDARIIVNNHGDTVCSSLRFTQNQTGTLGLDLFEAQGNSGSLVTLGGKKPPSWWDYFKIWRWRDKDPHDPASSKTFGLYEYVTTHKRELLTKMLVAAYVYSNYRLFSISMYLQSSDRWVTWKSNLSLAQLVEIPRQEFAQDLIREIQKRYAIFGNQELPRAECISIFLRDVDQEMQALQSYQRIVYWITRLDDLQKKCASVCGTFMPRVVGLMTSLVLNIWSVRWSAKSLFYIDEKLIELIPEKLARLAYLKKSLLYWIADVKMVNIRAVFASSMEFDCPHKSVRAVPVFL